MIGISIILLLFAHYVGDFELQTREMATRKSSDINYLADHASIMFMCYWSAGIILFSIYGDPLMSIYFAFLNATVHAIQDWNIWEGYKKRAPTLYWRDKAFYTTMGKDAFLHISVLLTTYFWMITYAHST